MFEEDRHNIISEPGYTCHYFDSIIDRLKEVFKNEVEEARDSNKELRRWGEEWKNKALEYFTRIQELEAEGDKLNSQLTEIEDNAIF